ncbi:ATP-grasp domain-containing protein [Arthrobacter sp. S13_S34]|nr:ATP-grasp domain-containing protein [Arthrobacter sp. S13_S34]
MKIHERSQSHILIVHRWRGEVARYADYVDHESAAVTYVVTQAGMDSFPREGAFDTEAVTTSGQPIATDEDIAIYAAAVQKLTERVGPVTRLIALHEGDLLAAAVIRERLGIAGDRFSDVLPFRDKLVMARRLQANGVDVPATEPVETREDISNFAADRGWPVFVKPRSGTGSSGAARLDGPHALDHFVLPDNEAMIVQPFVHGTVIHVDGYFTGTRLEVWKASHYLNTCYEFDSGATLGSVEIDDPISLSHIADFTTKVLRGITQEPQVFHLELFARNAKLTEFDFLEIAARVGGAEIPYVWREVHNTDLLAIAFSIQAGQQICLPPRLPDRTTGDVAGWLIVPPSSPSPCVVDAADSRIGTAGVYAEVLPVVGAVMPNVGGYEMTGARFRFRGQDTATVAKELLTLASNYELTTRPTARETLLVFGAGAHKYRKYGLQALAGQADIVLFDTVDLTWQQDYIDRYVRISRETPQETNRLVAELLLETEGPVAVMTWDETFVALVADVADLHDLPCMSPQAVANCRDKYATRSLLNAAGISPVHASLVSSEEEAVHEVRSSGGYPVILKPRSLAASVGVVLANDEAQLREAYRHSESSAYPGLGRQPGTLIEQFLDGDEISVDCIVFQGNVSCANVARKRLGPAPHFEEIGHLVCPWTNEEWFAEVEHMLQNVHTALGVSSGITHAEIRLTGKGPRLVELNCRLGGDLIPFLGYLAHGTDLVTAAKEIAFGRQPDRHLNGTEFAEVSFIYPDEDCVIKNVDAAAARAVPGIHSVHVLAEAGQVLRLPPRGVVPRVAAIIATGSSEEACADAIRKAANLLVITSSSLETAPV